MSSHVSFILDTQGAVVLYTHCLLLHIPIILGKVRLAIHILNIIVAGTITPQRRRWFMFALLLFIISSTTRHRWPETADPVFPEYLLASRQLISLQTYCRLLDGQCKSSAVSRWFLLGQAYLMERWACVWLCQFVYLVAACMCEIWDMSSRVTSCQQSARVINYIRCRNSYQLCFYLCEIQSVIVICFFAIPRPHEDAYFLPWNLHLGIKPSLTEQNEMSHPLSYICCSSPVKAYAHFLTGLNAAGDDEQQMDDEQTTQLQLDYCYKVCWTVTYFLTQVLTKKCCSKYLVKIMQLNCFCMSFSSIT